jgi:hypothetical protein
VNIVEGVIAAKTQFPDHFDPGNSGSCHTSVVNR